MAIKQPSIFEYMKKYELPMPLWLYSPELEQNDAQWRSLGKKLVVRKLKRFLDVRTEHDKQLYYRLFPRPFDWDDWMPKEEPNLPEELYVGKRLLRLRRWEPECPRWDLFPEDDSRQVLEGDWEDVFALNHWESFQLRMHKESPYNTEAYSVEHLLILGYALYRGSRSLYVQLQQEEPGQTLWQDTLHKALNCRTADWLELLPHLLGLGLYRKFTENNYLRMLLQETGDRPIVYIDPENKLLGGEFKDGKFCGENLYGIALMQVRSELNRVYDNLVLCTGTKTEEEAFDPFDMPF